MTFSLECRMVATEAPAKKSRVPEGRAREPLRRELSTPPAQQSARPLVSAHTPQAVRYDIHADAFELVASHQSTGIGEADRALLLTQARLASGGGTPQWAAPQMGRPSATAGRDDRVRLGPPRVAVPHSPVALALRPPGAVAGIAMRRGPPAAERSPAEQEHYYRKVRTLDDLRGEVPLSKRQAEILYYLLRGQPASEVARILHLSARTVEWHTQRIAAKFGCRSKSDMLFKAVNAHWVDMQLHELKK